MNRRLRWAAVLAATIVVASAVLAVILTGGGGRSAPSAATPAGRSGVPADAAGARSGSTSGSGSAAGSSGSASTTIAGAGGAVGGAAGGGSPGAAGASAAPHIMDFAAGSTRTPEKLPTADVPSSVSSTIDGCDRNYGTAAQCVPLTLPNGATNWCAWLAAHGYTNLRVVGVDDKHLDPKGTGIACG
jgi:hypothetical protein